MAAEGDNVFKGVMVCFTQASSYGADRHPGGHGGRPRYDPGRQSSVDSVSVTSDEINQFLE